MMLGHPWETTVLWGAVKPHLWVTWPPGRDAGHSHASPLYHCPAQMHQQHHTDLSSSRNPRPWRVLHSASSFPCICSVKAVLFFSLRSASDLACTQKSMESWAWGHALGHTCPPSTCSAPGIPHLPRGPTPSLGTSPARMLGGAVSPSVLCTPALAMGLSRGPWSKAKPFLTRCVPSRTPAGLCWLLQLALQAPWQRQQTLGRCMEVHLRAAFGDEGLVWPCMERCLLLLKYLQEISSCHQQAWKAKAWEHQGSQPRRGWGPDGLPGLWGHPCHQMLLAERFFMNSFIPIKKSQLFKKTNIVTSLQVLGPKGGAGEGLVMQCLWVRGENTHHGDLMYSTEMSQEAQFKKHL